MKEQNKIKDLAEKFWAAESTQDEESVLKQLAEQDDPNLSNTDTMYFKWLSAQQELKSQRPFVKPLSAEPKVIALKSRVFWPWAVAASVILALGVFWYNEKSLVLPKESMMADTYESPEEAWEATLQALALVNSKLQKGTKPMEKVEKLDKLNIIHMN